MSRRDPMEMSPTKQLPDIPNKRYFTIGEVAELCQLKPHVLRYWEQEFTELSPIKRRGNRRYYQQHDIQIVRTIRTLLYEEGFTIEGARSKLKKDKIPASVPHHIDNSLDNTLQILNEVVELLEK